MRSNKTLFSATILIALATSIKAIVINCNFTTFSVDDSIHLAVDKSPNVYGCVVVGFSDLNKPEVSITGNHTNLRGNDDVVGISVEDKNVGELLNNIGGVFVNVKDMLIRDCMISGIKFGGFKKLEMLVIVGSDLKEIGAEFFEENQNLKQICLSKNVKLTKIDEQAFIALQNLTILNLSENSCTNGAKLNQTDIKEVLDVIKLNCNAQQTSVNSLEPKRINSSLQQSTDIDKHELAGHLHSIALNHISAIAHLAVNHQKLLNQSQNSDSDDQASQIDQIMIEKSLNSTETIENGQSSTEQPTDMNRSIKQELTPQSNTSVSSVGPSSSPKLDQPTPQPDKPNPQSKSQPIQQPQSSTLQTPTTKTPDNPTPTSTNQQHNLIDSNTPKTTLTSTPNVAQSTGNSEMPKQSIDIKANEESTSESSGNGKAIIICVMFGAVAILMGAAMLVKRKQTKTYDGVLLIDSTDV